MGTILESFDTQIMPYRYAYTNAFAQNNYRLATHFVNAMHNTVPPAGRIENFKPFQTQERGVWYYSDKVNQLALQWCEYWLPQVESAIAVYRDILINQNRMS